MSGVPEFKLLLVGDGGVGKTTLVKRHRTGEFEKKYIATLGVEVHPMVFHTNHGPIRLNVWDTAGQERFKAITSAHYRKSLGALIVYDLTKENSFQSVKKWMEEVKEHADPDIVIMLVGNKLDLCE
jgi:GTP-binding nuclear protein Ran